MIAPDPSVPASTLTSSPADRRATSVREWVDTYAELAKVRIGLLVLVTTAVGFVVTAGALETATLLWTLLGTGLAAAGANSLNQLLEREFDEQMHRTRRRPLPEARVSPAEALVFGLTTAILGTLLLGFAVNATTAGLAAFTVFTYVLIYTPMKRWTPLCTLIGAVPGAIPPVIGVAAAGPLDASAAWLFLILFLWQLPHFYAIAWLYRFDYARGGFPMLSVVDPEGRRTARQSIFYMALLFVVSLLPWWTGVFGPAYGVAAALLGGLFAATVVDFARKRDDAAARRVFFASIAYLPLLLVVLAIEAL